MKIKNNAILFFLVFLLVSSSLTATENRPKKFLYEALAMQKQAKALAEVGELDKAIALYEKTLEPKYIAYDYEKGSAIMPIVKILRLQGRYDKALDRYRYFLEKKPLNVSQENMRDELLALNNYQTTSDAKSVRSVIDALKDDNAKYLPPKGYMGYSSVAISTILRLYNTIGDHAAGIKMIDECMEYFKQQDIKKHGKYRPGKTDEAYLKVRQGFEQDKAEGFKGCAGKKPGEVCMGRATKALIDSDYFPW